MDLWVNMKFMKSDVMPDVEVRPAVTLQPVDDRVFAMPCEVHSVDNPRETLLALCLPRGVHLALAFDLHQPVRRVLIDKDEQPFQVIGDTLVVHVAAREEDCRTGANIVGFISRPGLQVFINLPDPLRAAGAYAGAFPHHLSRTTLAMEFALRRAALTLGLDRSVGLSPVGPLNIMGFDTNNPHDHTDAPPHVHIHPRGTRVGAPITHYYYGEDGRLARNRTVWRQVRGPERILGRGETFEHRAPGGRLLYSTQITMEGGLRIEAPSGEVATATPEGGESTAAVLQCDETQTRFEAEMSFDTGVLSVDEGGRAEHHTFDIDTGRYLGEQPTPDPAYCAPMA